MNRQRIRFRQLDYSLDIFKDELKDWDIPNRGCGAVSIANILVNYGIETNPIEVLKKIICDESGNYDKTYVKAKGIAPEGLIYCLNRMIKEDNLHICYEIVKIDFDMPEKQKQKIVQEIRNGNMAIIHVGPKEGYDQYEGTFSKYGHYLVVSDVDENENFYVINSNKIGDEQIGVPFSYDTLIREMYGRKESFNFLIIKR